VDQPGDAAITKTSFAPEAFRECKENNMGGNVRVPTVTEARKQGRLILVVEDDEINRKLIRKQLDLLGYAAEMVNNGAEALEQWRRGGYALVLSDLHMPKMDGYMLTRAIRREETGQRIPILALTANALRGESNRALEVGMDEYLTKPVQLQTLKAALDKWLPLPREAPVRSENRDLEAPTAPVDPEALKELVGDDQAVVQEFFSDYLGASRRLAAEMLAAHAAADLDRLGACAHKFKSASHTVGAKRLGNLCAELEQACAHGNATSAGEKMAQFEDVYADVESEIEAILTEGCAAVGGKA
jgi:CheY-like chemotaxis protein/HPt (histidine-containing phosphotransfer) domain-containing protein